MQGNLCIMDVIHNFSKYYQNGSFDPLPASNPNSFSTEEKQPSAPTTEPLVYIFLYFCKRLPDPYKILSKYFKAHEKYGMYQQYSKEKKQNNSLTGDNFNRKQSELLLLNETFLVNLTYIYTKCYQRSQRTQKL